MPVYTDQALTLNAIDNQGRDMDTIDFRVDYWAPSNTSKNPTGTIDAGDITTVPGSSTVLIDVVKNIMTSPRDWRFQLIDNTSNLGWTTMVVPVVNAGS